MINPEVYKSWDGVITRRYAEPVPFPTPADPPSVDPLQCPYDAVAINTRDAVKIVNERPKRRISIGARVIPAEVGDPCKIWFNGKEMFLQVMEGVPFREACP